MKRIAIAVVTAALISALPMARASDGGACCACVQTGELGQTSQAAPSTSPALFCSASRVQNSTALAERCGMLGGDPKLLCVADDVNGTCVEILAEAGVGCPTSPAPAVTPYNLAALAVGLGLLGVALLRRRRA
jgi:MYXO-CTERM domain-containing protein